MLESSNTPRHFLNPAQGEEAHMQSDEDIVIERVGPELPVILVDRQALYDPALSWTAVGVLMRLRADSQPVRQPAPADPSQTREALKDLAIELCDGRPDRPADVLAALNELLAADYLSLGGA